jgi:hypothetical protein
MENRANPMTIISLRVLLFKLIPPKFELRFLDVSAALFQILSFFHALTRVKSGKNCAKNPGQESDADPRPFAGTESPNLRNL